MQGIQLKYGHPQASEEYFSTLKLLELNLDPTYLPHHSLEFPGDSNWGLLMIGKLSDSTFCPGSL